MRFLLAALAIAAALAGCSHLTTSPPRAAEGSPSIEELVTLVRGDPAKKPLLARSLMRGTFLMIPNPHAQTLAVLPFYQNERSFIPIFSDAKIFDEEAYGTGFAGKAVPVAGELFASLLEGNETVILNPGHRPAIEFEASQLKASVKQPS